MLSIIIIEKLIFNCILRDNSLIYKIENNYFSTKIAQDFFNVLKELSEKKLELNNIHIIAYGNKVNLEINEDFLNKIKIDFDISKFEEYLYQLRCEYAKKNIQKILLTETLVEVSKKGVFDLEKINYLQNEIQKNLGLIYNTNLGIKSLDNLLTSFEKDIIQRTKKDNSYQTGDSYLDENFRIGFLPGEMTTIVSDSGIGKTTFKQNLILKRINKRLPTLDVNLELAETTYVQRFLCNRLDVNADFFYPDSSYTIDDYVFDKITREKEDLKISPYYRYIREDNLSIDRLKEIVRNYKKEMGYSYLLLCLDVTTRLEEFNNDKGNTASMYEIAVKKLAKLAYSENIHILNVVHANRDWENIKINKIEDIEKLIPKASSIKNSSAFEKDSRLILGLMRKKFYMEKYFPKCPELEITDDIMTVHFLKNNDGGLPVLKYLFEGEKYKILKYVED